MLLYIVRHAFAGEHGDPRFPDDSLRPVTKKGKKRFDRLVKKLVQSGLSPTVIGTSPYLRCRQTAEILAQRLETPVRPQIVEAFAPGCRVEEVLSWARQVSGSELAFVGHAPDVDTIAGELLGSGKPIRVAKGAIAAIEFADQVELGQGELKWLVVPKLFS
jgi:phosphohistidine phosphatase